MKKNKQTRKKHNLDPPFGKIEFLGMLNTEGRNGTAKRLNISTATCSGWMKYYGITSKIIYEFSNPQ